MITLTVWLGVALLTMPWLARRVAESLIEEKRARFRARPTGLDWVDYLLIGWIGVFGSLLWPLLLLGALAAGLGRLLARGVE